MVHRSGSASFLLARVLSQSEGGRRSCLVSVRRCFAFSRRSFAPRLGVVGLRAGEGGRRASATTAASRARAASRLRSCARCSDATIVSTPPTRRPLSRSRTRSRCSGERTADPAASHASSTRESAVFTPCPPGPDDRENRHESSDSGIVTPAATLRPGRWGAGMNPSCSCVDGAAANGVSRRSLPAASTPSLEPPVDLVSGGVSPGRGLCGGEPAPSVHERSPPPRERRPGAHRAATSACGLSSTATASSGWE